MKLSIKNLGRDLVHSNGFFYTLLRSGVAAQTSGWLDFGVSFVMFTWCGLEPVYAAAIGAVAGGIANCLINYRFTFRDKECPWKAVVIKFLLVWLGSLALNSFGTEGLYWTLRRWNWLEYIGFKPSGYFTAARLFTALVVSFAWNFVLQRYFVYRSTRFDRMAVKLANLLFHGKFKVMVQDMTQAEMEINAPSNES